MRKTIISLFCVVLFCICGTCTVRAEDTYIPDNEIELGTSSTATYSQSDGGSKKTTHKTKDPVDVARDLFDTSGLDLRPTESTETITDNMTVIASKIMVVALSLFPSLVIIQLVIDVFCIAFKPIAYIFCNWIPIQLFSAEAAKQAGLQMKSSGGQGGDVAPPPSSAGDGQGAKAGIMSYVTARGGVIIICSIILMLAGTGLLFKIVNACCNVVYNIIVGAIG